MKKYLKKFYLILILLNLTTLQANEADIKETDLNITASFDKAFIGIPKGVLGRGEPFYGTLDEALVKIPNLKKFTKKLPTILYMQGSGAFDKGKTFREWLTGEGGYIFIAPNTHAIENRPTYSFPAPKNLHEKVHACRQAEIAEFVKRADELGFVDLNHTFLMGYSEGALAVARYDGDEFIGRMVLGWSCEPGYYTDYPKVGAKIDDPFLNIIGRDDQYFGKQSPWNNAYDNEGHCGDALFRFTNAKVVLLPNTGHNITKNPFTKNELLSFIELFKNHRIPKKTKPKPQKKKTTK